MRGVCCAGSHHELLQIDVIRAVSTVDHRGASWCTTSYMR